MVAHKRVRQAIDEFEGLVTAIKGMPNSDIIGVAQNNWSFPAVSRDDLVASVEKLRPLFVSIPEEPDEAQMAEIEEVRRRVAHVRSQTVPQLWGSSQHAVPALIHTLDAVEARLQSLVAVDAAGQEDLQNDLRDLKKKVRHMRTASETLQQRTVGLDAKVAEILAAHDAAVRLPTDLADLEEHRAIVARVIEGTTKDQARAQLAREEVERIEGRLQEAAVRAAQVVENAQSAYRAATSQGLAAAFTERSKALSTSMWVWVVGLIVALAVGSLFGSRQLVALTSVAVDPKAPWGIVVLNVALAFLSVAAPVWFAWLATKQVGQRFRLAEDYSFKAAVSRSYEGYRTEAARVDPALEARLLASALTRLDEEPLRVVNTEIHGSPWHEVLSSDVVKQAAQMAPDFVNQVRDLAKNTVDGLAAAARRTATASAEKNPEEPPSKPRA